MWDILETKNEEKNQKFMVFNFLQKCCAKSNWYSSFKNSTLHHNISSLGGGSLLQRLSVKISINICYTITQSNC